MPGALGMLKVSTGRMSASDDIEKLPSNEFTSNEEASTLKP